MNTQPTSRQNNQRELPLLFGPYGSNAQEQIRQFREYGANALWFHGFNAAAFETCAAHQIAACVEFKTFRADFAERPELVPIGVDGKPIRHGRLVQGVCLSQKAFLAETEANLRAGLRDFQPTGIWLDYLTYGGWFESTEPDLQESCFCPACIADFCDTTGIDADEPTAILASHQAAWSRHKCERVAGHALHYAQMIRQQLPDCVVGAYMCPWTPDEFDGARRRIFAQDYTLMAPAIDIFTPLIYGTKSGRGADWGATWLAAAPEFVPADRKVQLILDALDFPASLAATGESTQPSYGLQVFGGAQIFANPAWADLFRAVVEKIRDKLGKSNQG